MGEVADACGARHVAHAVGPCFGTLKNEGVALATTTA